LPAQAVLQINRAFSAKLNKLDGTEKTLQKHPLPYTAVEWILKERPDKSGQFLGNPRRHWQHYASRLTPNNSLAAPALRVARSWACWALAGYLLPANEFPNDQEQINRENLQLPSRQEIYSSLDKEGLEGEAQLWQSICRNLESDA